MHEKHLNDLWLVMSLSPSLCSFSYTEIIPKQLGSPDRPHDLMPW